MSLDMATATKMFYTQAINEGKLPFQPSYNKAQTEYTLKYNDKAQTIMGINIPDRKDYLYTKFVIQNEIFEGWKTTKKDIERLIYNDKHPNEEYIKDYNRIFKDDEK